MYTRTVAVKCKQIVLVSPFDEPMEYQPYASLDQSTKNKRRSPSVEIQWQKESIIFTLVVSSTSLPFSELLQWPAVGINTRVKQHTTVVGIYLYLVSCTFFRKDVIYKLRYIFFFHFFKLNEKIVIIYILYSVRIYYFGYSFNIYYIFNLLIWKYHVHLGTSVRHTVYTTVTK